jgi:CRISPR/Cas system CSM-associated protein Csm2 small subunit
VKRGPYAATITKEMAREALREVVMQHMPEMVQAQVAHAKGLTYLVRRDKGSGKFVRVTADMLDKQSDDDVIEMWTKEPNVPAFTDLLNRALDKPKEQEQALQVHGKMIIEIAKGW